VFSFETARLQTSAAEELAAANTRASRTEARLKAKIDELKAQIESDAREHEETGVKHEQVWI
jgi:hypothetical protein